ncbi:MAG: lipoyl(octanoyl) transferase LipB [Bacteroides sp.]|nr:lipoyl(octanoyl) transferase LipB [Bacteroides sp.]
MKIEIIDWGTIEYSEAWKRQEDAFQTIINSKLNNREYKNKVYICEHPNVYTLGKSGKDSNFLITEDYLKTINASLFHIDRGGDITYHGPGQIVCYPIINLQDFNLGVREYVDLLEEAVIRTCKDYGVETERLEGATGVWIEPKTSRARKICAIGVKCSRYVTMHGLAFNVNTDLSYFRHINPCGFIDKGVTSLSKELNQTIDISSVKQRLNEHLLQLLLANSVLS